MQIVCFTLDTAGIIELYLLYSSQFTKEKLCYFNGQNEKSSST